MFAVGRYYMLSFVQSFMKRKRKCNSFPLSDILDLGCNRKFSDNLDLGCNGKLSDILDLGCNGKLSGNLDQSKKCYFVGNGVENLAAVVRKT